MNIFISFIISSKQICTLVIFINKIETFCQIIKLILFVKLLLIQLIFVLLLNIVLIFIFFNCIYTIKQTTKYKVLKKFIFAIIFLK